MCVIHCFSHVCLFATLYTIARQSLLSIGFSRQEYWGGLPRPPPGDLPHPGIKPVSLMSPELAGVFFTTRATWEAPLNWDLWKKELTQQAGVSYTSYITMKDFLLWLGTYLLEYFWNDLIMFCMLDASSVQSLSCVQLFVTPWPAVRQASLSITNSWSIFKLMAIESVMPSKHLILCRPLLLPRSIIPSIRIFSEESVLCLRWPKY